MSNVKNSYELVNFCEIDKFAAKSYCAVHNVDPNLNLGDITKVNERNLMPFNMICGGSPCQDFSVAGKQEGSTWRCATCGYEYNPLTVHWTQRNVCPKCGEGEIDKTRSSLLVEWLRIIQENKPRWGIFENVKNLVGTKFKDTFDLFLEELHEYGYNTYYKVLNAKDYGVPQNRERVYLIFILQDFDNGKFKFPTGFDSGVRLKDLLEDDVDEKFYINTPKAKEIIENYKSRERFNRESLGAVRTGVGGSLDDHSWDVVLAGENKMTKIDDLYAVSGGKNKRGRIWSTDGIGASLAATDYKSSQIILETNGRTDG